MATNAATQAKLDAFKSPMDAINQAADAALVDPNSPETLDAVNRSAASVSAFTGKSADGVSAGATTAATDAAGALTPEQIQKMINDGIQSGLSGLNTAHRPRTGR